MAKVLDITEKLTFEENPKIKIKDKEIEVNADATTVLKIMSYMQNGEAENHIIDMYELVFNEKDRNIINSLKLNAKDLMTLIQEAMKLAAGNEDDDEGEA